MATRRASSDINRGRHFRYDIDHVVATPPLRGKYQRKAKQCVFEARTLLFRYFSVT